MAHIDIDTALRVLTQGVADRAAVRKFNADDKGVKGQDAADFLKIRYLAHLKKHGITHIDVTQFKGISETAQAAAKATGQLSDVTTQDIIAQFKSGEYLPNEILGISTKSVLAALLLFCLLKRGV